MTIGETITAVNVREAQVWPSGQRAVRFDPPITVRARVHAKNFEEDRLCVTFEHDNKQYFAWGVAGMAIKLGDLTPENREAVQEILRNVGVDLVDPKIRKWSRV